ncbi:MAG: flagellar basal body rod C-terminal domain-containing protein [Succinivibrio sp.]
MSVDLILTGKYGVLNSQKLLNATSNNINNVNTEGYIRKETLTYTSCVDWGVGNTYTRRIYDQYVQRQLFTDTANKEYYSAYKEGMDTADKVLSDSTMSIANAATSMFDNLSTAVNNPTSSANRAAAKASIENLVERVNYANDLMLDSLNTVNNQISDDVNDINSLTQAICNINGEIRSLSISDNATNNEIYMQMLDERDRLIGELSQYVSLNVKEQQDGAYEVYMDSGMLLANGDVYAQLSQEQSSYDVTKSDIYLTYKSIYDSGKDQSHVKLNPNTIGGSLGGYLNSTTEIRNTMRELGKTVVALADALNVQNKAGFTLEDIAGDNLFTIPGGYGRTTNNDDSIYFSFNEGQGSNVQGYSFQVSFTDGDFHLYRVDGDDNKVDITAQIAAPAGTDTSVRLDDYGITLTFNKTIDELKTNKTSFYVQPTLMVGSQLESNITKPEDLAFSSAVRTRTSSNNLGNATISLSRCSNTGTNYGVSVDPTTKKPVFNAGAPTTIRIDDAGNYVIYDNDGNILGRAPASCNGTNVLANAVTYDALAGAYTTTPLKDYGYDVSVTGTVRENDSYTIEINDGGQADNTNGTALIQIRNETITRTTGSSKTTTFNDGYANLLAELGASITTAAANEEAAAAKLDQTTKLYQSDAGVNLDEEATNLLMYQQSYQSCAKIIEASQTIFNALLNSF